VRGPLVGLATTPWTCAGGCQDIRSRAVGGIQEYARVISGPAIPPRYSSPFARAHQHDWAEVRRIRRSSIFASPSPQSQTSMQPYLREPSEFGRRGQPWQARTPAYVPGSEIGFEMRSEMYAASGSTPAVSFRGRRTCPGCVWPLPTPFANNLQDGVCDHSIQRAVPLYYRAPFM